MNLPVHSNSQETGDGTNEGHAQQRVDNIVQLGLGRTRLLQCATVSEGDHQRLEGFGEAGDGVECCQAADEAVHGRVKVTVPDDRHHHQEVLSQAD